MIGHIQVFNINSIAISCTTPLTSTSLLPSCIKKQSILKTIAAKSIRYTAEPFIFADNSRWYSRDGIVTASAECLCCSLLKNADQFIRKANQHVLIDYTIYRIFSFALAFA